MSIATSARAGSGSLLLGTALSVLALGGCLGQIGGDGQGAGAGSGSGGEFPCIADEQSATVLARLSKQHYLASLRDLATRAVGADVADVVLDTIEGTLTVVPGDTHDDHSKLDQTVSQAHIDGYYYVAVAFARELTSTPERLSATMGACATDSDSANDAACLEDFIRGFGSRAHRHPLSQADVAFYRDEVFAPATGMEAAAVADVITVMVLSPRFLYLVENEGTPVDERQDLLALAPFELASRLSYHFWGAPPDDELYAAAENGSLATEEGYTAQVDRLIGDPRTRANFDLFFREWFLLDDLAPLHQSVGTPTYDAFLDGFVPGEELRERVIEEALDLTRYTTWTSGGTLDDLFLSNLSFAKTEDVASLYGGVPLWHEGDTPIALPEPGRSGILTRAAMLATGSSLSHPILRGREIRRRVLCDDLPPPPPDAMSDLPELDPAITERERMEAYTAGEACASCHTMMNPIGFVLDRYDGLGRHRETARIFDDAGGLLAELPIDTHATPRITASDGLEVSDGAALSQLVVASGKPHACFVRHYFRFTFARYEDDDVDGCTLDGLHTALRKGASVAEVMRGIALSPTFRRRQLSP
jgi:hypothetical protein